MSKASGVGKKTAERIIVELRDKINKSSETLPDTSIYEVNDVKSETIEVLMSLGFNKSEIIQVVDKLFRENKDIETNELVKLSLGRLGKF